MKKILVLFSVLLLSATISLQAQTEKVLVTKTGKAYHKLDATDIKQSKDVTRMTITEAKKKGLTACQNCWPTDTNKDADKTKTKTKTKNK